MVALAGDRRYVRSVYLGAPAMPIAPTPRSKRRAACAAVCCVTALGLHAAPASAQSARASEGEATALLSAVTAGLGELDISPGSDGTDVTCQTDAQEDVTGQCTQSYPVGTVVRVTARPTTGSFLGWSDFECSNRSTTCELRMTGDRFITARFSRVVLSVGGTEFGRVRVSPPGAFCELMADSPPCTFTYGAGTLVTLRREDPSRGEGKYWIGACEGNFDGVLDATTCRVRLQSSEDIGAGYAQAGEIPPARGTALQVVVSGKNRGRVTGTVINKGRTLNCGPRCKVSGLTLYDAVRLKATRFRGGRFAGWSDGSRLTQRVVQLSRVTKIKATFRRR